MANIKSSKKDKKKSYKRRQHNISKKSKIKTFLKKVLFYVQKKDLKNCVLSFKNFQSVVDKCSLKKIIHKNKASNYKHNLIKKIKQINIKN
ncbi:30S ribosomal protein S20 [Buchnera aphidicola (Astegopteryx bambusae)]|uniref:30S ribosomal protein S20 n=1 Tax=Buchnera aphidicola TaxID=9 RepID=UPI0031B8A4FE